MTFSKTHLIVVSTATVLALFLAGLAWQNVLNPEARTLAELQDKRAQNERLIQELKAEHDKVAKLRDEVAVKLGELNAHLAKVEEKGRQAREANADLTSKIENGGKE